MKHHHLYFVLLCILLSTRLFGQQATQHLNTLIKASELPVNESLEVVKVINMESLNTAGIEYSPVFYKNGIAFSSDRYLRQGMFSRWLNNNNSNLYFTGINESGQSYEPIPLPGEVNSKRHEGSATFSADGTVMIYTRNCDKPSVFGFYELKLSAARFEKGQWVDHMDLPFNDGYRTCHPALSKDGTLLIFASNRPNGLGGMDLFASEYVNGAWTTPYNLGQEVNSSGDEVFPYLDVEGTLYFASNGRPGMGGLDIFKTTRNKLDVFGESLRLPEPFNTRWDDFSFVTNINFTKGFFSSNRPGGKGMDDIYNWTIHENMPLPEPVQDADAILTQIIARDEQTGLALQEVKINLIQINPDLLQTGFLDEPIAIVSKLHLNVAELLGTTIEPIQAPNSPTLYPVLADKKYLLIAEQQGHKPMQQLVSAAQLTANEQYALVMKTRYTSDMLVALPKESVAPPIAAEEKEFVVVGLAMVGNKLATNNHVMADPLESGKPEEIFTAREIPAAFIKPNMAPLADAALPEDRKVLSFNNLYHHFNASSIAANEVQLISNIILDMQQNPEYQLTIRSHTDQRGTNEYNLMLSQKRALAVMGELIQGGIAPERLSASGLGEAFPIQDCQQVECTEEEHQLNRRTEFVITRRSLMTNKS